MKTKTLYTCEICNTDYANKEDAKKCEKEHIKGAELVSTRIHAHQKYPHKIEVRFANGVSIWYRA